MKASFFPTMLICVTAFCVPNCSETATATREAAEGSPLRVAEPADSIIADLREFLPHYLEQQSIPGAAIVLVRDGRILWGEGFGVANVVSREPVDTATIFEVASLSKVVTAYLALRMVDEGKLALDRPLHGYLHNEWLPPSAYRDSITLRHVLSHSSGLGKTSREILFKPGTAYYYSANGSNLTKAVLEEVSGESFEDLAQRMVFGPLGMSHSSFLCQEQLIPVTANGHVRAIFPSIVFGVVYALEFLVVLLIGMVFVRVRTGSWKLKRKHMIAFYVVAFILSIAVAFVLMGKMDLTEFAWLLAMLGIALLAAFMLLFYAGKTFLTSAFPGRIGLQRLLASLMGILVAVVVLFLAAQIRNVPVPRSPTYDARAAGSLRTSAGELARFMIEVAHPKLLKEETAKYLRTPQINLSSQLSWGLGPGILHSPQGDALWQWGQHIDFQTIMIVYPERDWGAVVCTNSDLLSADVALEIAHRALGGSIDPIRKAIHLHYDFREK